MKGRYGDALKFDGHSTCVSIPESESLRLGEEFTFETWVRPEGTLGEEPLIFEESGGGPGVVLGIGIGAGGSPEGWAEGEEITAPHDVEEDAWTHLAYTYDGGRMRLFVNGEQVTSRWVGAETMESKGPLRIGCWPGHEYSEARIDEPRVYDRALNVGEVAADMETPLQTPKQEPVASYSFDEGLEAGTTVEDLSGDGNEATLEGATRTEHGRYGGALSFDGPEEQCASVPTSEDLQLGEEFTLEAWARADPGAEEDPILFKETGGSFSYALGIGFQGGERPEAYLGEEGEGGGYERVVSPTAVEPGVWTHVAATYDGARLRLYVDGTEVAERYVGGGVAASTGPLYIGCAPAENEWFGGRIDEVRLYERALGLGEVDADMEAPLQTPRSGPIAAYSFDEGTGTTVEDLGGENDGTVEGAGWVKGRYGDALKFDGDSSCVSIPESESLELGEEFTFETWVRPEGTLGEEPLIFEETEGGPSVVLGIGIGAGGRPEGWAEGEEIAAPHDVEEDVWTHLAYTYDGARMRLYVDGEQVASRFVGSETFESKGPLRIGCWPGHEYSEARIDEPRVYDRALDGGEIQADMETPLRTPRQGPVAAYSFDEGLEAGSTVEDVTGDEHEGTIEGATRTEHGRYGGALSFDGPEEQCASVPTSEDLQLGEEFTLEAWARADPGAEEDPILFKETGSSFSYALGIGFQGGERPEAYLGEEGKGGGYERVVSPTAVEPGVWTHVAATYDGARLRLYVDGAKVAEKYVGGGVASSNGPLYIGCAPAENEWFGGRIDEVRLYERALAQAEIQDSMGPLPTAETEGSIETHDTTAVLSGKINPRGGEATYWFEYGPTTAYGQYGPFGPFEGEHVVTGTEPVEVLEAIPGLEPSTTYHYRLIAYDGATKTVGPDRTLTTAEPEVEPLSASGKTFGLDYRSVPDAAKKSTAHLVAESNATMFRVAIGCPNQEYDEIFEHAAEEEVTILPDIVGVAEHVEETKLGSHHFKCPGKHGNFVPPPEEHEAWRQELEAIVHRYGHGGTFWAEHEFSAELIPDHWEIWNEENTGRFGSTARRIQPSWYGSLLEEAHEAITSVDPNAQILLGGLLSVPKARPTAAELQKHPGLEDEIDPARFLKQMGHYNAFDEASLHPYVFRGFGKVPHAPNNPKDVETVTRRVWANIGVVRATLNELGSPTNGMPIWITEIGWPVKGGGANPEDHVHWLVNEEIQRDLLNSTFDMMKGESKDLPTKRFRISAIMYYNIADAVNAEPKGQWDFHCGLVEDSVPPEKGEKRKAWYAFQEQAE